MKLIDADALIEKCGEWYVEEGPEDGFIGTIKQLIDTQPTIQSEQRWVPCSERLPEDFKKVLVFWWEHSEPMIDTAFWQKDAKRFDGQHWVRIEDKITHWMPLPEPARLEND